jgi:hypothetical protein
MMKNFTKFKLLCLLLLSVAGTPAVRAQVATTCIPTYSSGCGVGDDIDDVTLVGQSVTLSNLNTPCPSGGYQDYTTSTTLGIPDLLPGQTYSGTVTTNYTGLYEYYKIWIDFNDNGTFEATEEVASAGPINNASTGAFTTSVIPLTATPGMKRMRVVLNYSSSPSSACGSFTWGETHDYKVQILSLVPCTNPPVAGTATITPNTQSCPGFPTTLSLSGIVMGSGQTYEWESSPNNTTYTSLGPASLSPNLTVSPLFSTWYRCKVVCSGGTPAYSTPVQITVAPGLSGTYTINSAQPTGGTNFNNFADAATALNCGIVAPVTINVVAGSGPYTGTFNLNTIGGASATNKVRINGNGETIQFNSTGTTNHRIVSLNGTKYLTIDNLKIKTLNASYGWGIHITGNAEYDSIKNCIIDLSTITGTSSVNASGIVLSGTETSPTTSSNVKNIYIGNNSIIAGSTGAGGGYYGITSTGTTGFYNDSLVIVNNEITNFYYYGIRVTYASNPQINHNNIHRTTQTAISAAAYGIYYYYCLGGEAIGNRIHDLAAPGVSSTSSFYGMYNYNYNNTTTTPILIANNAIYNLGNYNGTQYLMYNYGPAHKVYHNTIDVSAVQGANTGAIYSMYNGYNTGCDYANNIINITGGNTGTKYGMYHATSSYAATYRKNNVYFNSSQTGTQTPYYWGGTSYASLAAFQAAQPTQEVGSPSVPPQFTSVATGDLTPTNGALIGTGVNVYTDVPMDINGLPRSGAPTIGAFEIAPQGINNARMFSILKPTGNVCSGAQQVEVIVGNAGTNNITNMQINWSLNGVVQTPLSYSTPTYPTLVPVTTPGGQFSDTVVIGNANLVAGSNVIRVWTSMPNGQVDPYPSNDTAEITITPANFSLSTANDTVCYNATFALSLTPGSPYTANSLQWESSTNGGATWSTLATNNSSTYTVNNLTAGASYRVKILTGGNACYSNVKDISIFNITVPTAVDGERCGPGEVAIGAVPGAGGGTLRWYETATSTTSVGTGNSFTTPNIAATTTYYVSTSVGGGGNLVGGIPTPTSTTGNSGFSDLGLMFDAVSSFTISSVDVYPMGTASTNGSVTIALKNSAGATLQSTTATVTVSATGALNTVPLNFTVTPGTNYRLVITAATGMSTIIRETTGFSYPYTLPGVLSITSAYTGGASTLYYYYLYNWKIAAGCESSRVPVVATIREVPNPQLGNDLDTCTFNAIPMTLDPGPQPAGSTYLWDNNSTANTRALNTTGVYHVTVTTPHGCIGTDTINISMREKPAIDLSVNGTSFCVGSTKILDAGPGGQNGGTYYWNTGEQSQSIVVNNGGTYIVFVTSADGCVNSDTITVVENGFAPSVDGILSYATGAAQFQFEASNPQHVVGYEWDFGDGSPISTDPTPNHAYSSNGYYMVVLKSNSVCADRSDTTYINILGVGIKNVDELANSITIYPNPNSAKILYINSKDESKIHNVTVTNILGQEVATLPATPMGKGTYQIELPSHLGNGIYSIKLETDKGIATKKLEILR